MKDKPNFIVFDKCLLERFWAAKKDKNNAINQVRLAKKKGFGEAYII